MTTRTRVREADAAIKARLDFKAGAMTGRYVTRQEADSLDTGVLPHGWAVQLRETVRGTRAVYVIWSCRTPIGWVVEASGEDVPETRVVPALRYSLTTTTHQGEVRSAFEMGRDWQSEQRAVPANSFGPRFGW